MWPRPAGSSASLGPATTSGRTWPTATGSRPSLPKARRAPQMPEATPTTSSRRMLTLAVAQPTIGCRQYADRLGDQGFSIAKSTVQKHLVAHGLGRRSAAPGPGGRDCGGDDRTGGAETPRERTSPSASAWPRAVRVSSSASTASTSASSRAWARCTSSAPSTSSPASPSWPSCLARRPGPCRPASSAQMLRLYRRYGIRVRAVSSDIQADCALGSTVRPAGGGKLQDDRCPLCIAADRSERLTTPCLLGVSRVGATPGKERPVRYSVTGLGRIPVGECPARPPRWRRPSVPTQQGGISAETHAGSRCRLSGGRPGQPG